MALPIKGVEFTFIAKLDSVLNDGFQVNPTLATGDFQSSTDGAAFVNVAIPVVTPSGSSSVLVTVSAAAADGDTVEILAKDQTSPIEWNEVSYVFELFDGSLEVVNDILQGDITESSASVTIKRKGTSTVLVQKDITGSLLSTSVTVNTSEP
jgi:hypothetical protein